MNLKAIILESLRLMRLDTTASFKESVGIDENNLNILEKLPRIIDTINRGILRYHTFVGYNKRTIHTDMTIRPWEEYVVLQKDLDEFYGEYLVNNVVKTELLNNFKEKVQNYGLKKGLRYKEFTIGKNHISHQKRNLRTYPYPVFFTAENKNADLNDLYNFFNYNLITTETGSGYIYPFDVEVNPTPSFVNGTIIDANYFLSFRMPIRRFLKVDLFEKKTRKLVKENVSFETHTYEYPTEKITFYEFHILDEELRHLRTREEDYFIQITYEVAPATIGYYNDTSFIPKQKGKKVVFSKKENDTFFEGNIAEDIKERIIDNHYDFDMTILGLPESFLNVLPLYVAGELYFEDEPQIAQKYLKDFDEFIYYEPKLDRVKQTRIKKINRIW